MASRAEKVKNAAKMKPDEASNPSNPKVYFDVKIGEIHAGRITFEVRNFMDWFSLVGDLALCHCMSYGGALELF